MIIAVLLNNTKKDEKQKRRRSRVGEFKKEGENMKHLLQFMKRKITKPKFNKTT